MRTVSVALCALAGAMLLPLSARALVINGENATQNYRFTSGYPGAPVPNLNPNFVAADYDLSGVGWSSGNADQSFTMISDEYFVFATHHPPASSTISFYSPAGAGSVVSYAIDTTFYMEYPLQGPTNHLKSDLSIGRLEVAIDPADEIAFYPILDLPTEAHYVGQDLLVYGLTAAVGTGVIGDLGTLNLYNNVGTPTISSDDVLNTPTVFDSVQDTFGMLFTNTGGAGQASLQGGDSGSPSFVVWNGSLALVGIHAGVNGANNFDTFLPAYLGGMAAANVEFTTVPEPTTLWLLGGAMFVMVSRRARRAAR